MECCGVWRVASHLPFQLEDPLSCLAVVCPTKCWSLDALFKYMSLSFIPASLEPLTGLKVSPMWHKVTSSWNLGTVSCLEILPSQCLQKAQSAARGALNVEKLWHQFFSDPSQWWDTRLEKVNSRYPDLKHKTTGESLWLNRKLNPPWVEEKLAAMAPGTVQLHIFTWNRRLAKTVKAGHFEKTLELFEHLEQDGINPDEFTFVPVVNACIGLQALEKGRYIHTQILQWGFESNVYVGSSLVDMYAKFGSIDNALSVFNKMPKRDVVAWVLMIKGCVKCGQGQKALELSKQMWREGIKPNTAIFVGLLNACAIVALLEEGRRVHSQIIQSDCEANVFISSSLIHMYAKCGSIKEAEIVFNRIPVRNVAVWNAMIAGYVRCGQGQKALELYHQMQKDGSRPDSVTFVGALNACASLAALEEGRSVHTQIVESGCETQDFVCSSLVDMYAKCGNIEAGWTVFKKMPTRHVEAWNAMISGYVKCGLGEKGLELFRQMQQEGLKPDGVTFVAVLNACASVAALEEGRRVHKQVIQSGYESDVFVGTCLVNMYAKCGSIKESQIVFKMMPTRNSISWGAMLGAYAMHGQAKEALKHFEWMCQEGVDVDGVIFLSLLSACGHGGLVGEGLHYFELMTSVCRIPTTVDHFACIVDLLGRAGRLHNAEELVMSMTCKANVNVWMSLLGASRIHGNVQIGERAARRVQELDPGNATCYVLLSNIYAAASD